MLTKLGAKIDFRELLDFYRRHLLEDVIPFWMKHAFNPTRGGIDTCLADDGSLLSTDRYMWSQMRAVWTFSALYNRIEAREEWLDKALRIYRFAREHGRDERRWWYYCLSADGKLKEGPISIYSDAFAIYGLTELVRATDDREVLDLAMETFEEVLPRIEDWDTLLTAPYAIPKGCKAHGVSMIFSQTFDELAQATDDPRIGEAVWFHSTEVMDHYLRPDRRLLFEYIGTDNALVDSPAGRAVVPGHAIESMWFQIHLLRRRGEEARIKRAVEAIRWHLEAGWDEEYGGILLAIDAEGREPPYWKFADTKPWWIATEALYALLLAYEITREPWCLDWYRRVHEYAFTHYPDPEHGDWHQKLDRQGHVIDTVIALPVKDPYHLPRALINCIEVLERLAD